VLVAVGTLIAAAAHGRYYEQIRKAFEQAALPVDGAGLAACALEPDHVARAIAEAGRIKPERYTILEEVGPERMIAVFKEVYGLS